MTLDKEYQETLDYMFTQLPMYQRIGQAAYKENLDNTIALLDLLDNPHRKMQTIHVAGTNGKGSTSHFLASILQTAGYKVGLYTSPHLRDFRERIKINGEMISQRYVVDFISQNKAAFEAISPSFFEMTVGLAFQYFVEEKTDIAIIEVGLGGRLDSTNVVLPEVSVITNIDFDHVQFLGDTLEKIAFEKAGIIKENIPVVVGETQPQTENVFRKKATEMHAPIWFADHHFKVVPKKSGEGFFDADIFFDGKLYLENLHSPLAGLYQLKNLATVCQVVEILNARQWNLPEETIRLGIENMVKNTGLLGRWQILSRNPLSICDTGHNEAGLKYVLQQISETPHEKLHFVLGMVNDKDVDKVLSMLPKEAVYYFCCPDIPRGLEVDILVEKAHNKGFKGMAFSSVKEAFEAAQKAAGKNDLVFVGGSTFVVAEVV